MDADRRSRIPHSNFPMVDGTRFQAEISGQTAFHGFKSPTHFRRDESLFIICRVDLTHSAHHRPHYLSVCVSPLEGANLTPLIVPWIWLLWNCDGLSSVTCFMIDGCASKVYVSCLILTRFALWPFKSVIRHGENWNRDPLDDRQDNELLKGPVDPALRAYGRISFEWMAGERFLGRHAGLTASGWSMPMIMCPTHLLLTQEDWRYANDARLHGWRRSRSRHFMRPISRDLGRINTCQRPRRKMHRVIFAQFTVQTKLVRQMSHFRAIIGPTTHCVAKQKLRWATWMPDPTDPDSGYQP